MVNRILYSIRKSRRLKQISRRLSKPFTTDDFIKRTFSELQKSNIENVSVEFEKNKFIGRILAKPVYKDRTNDFIDKETGKIITAEEIHELRNRKKGGVTEHEFEILKEVLYQKDTILTIEKIENIINTGYSWVYLYKAELKSDEVENDVIDELIDLALSDEYICRIVDEYQADRAILMDIYDKLLLAGAGQYSKGHFVAASSLVYPMTLKFILENYQRGQFFIKGLDNKNSSMFIAYLLIKYFANNETGEVSY
ncbi:MAG: hypothetical protein WDZ47_01245 [Bacteroidales bacterium]